MLDKIKDVAIVLIYIVGVAIMPLGLHKIDSLATENQHLKQQLTEVKNDSN